VLFTAPDTLKRPELRADSRPTERVSSARNGQKGYSASVPKTLISNVSYSRGLQRCDRNRAKVVQQQAATDGAGS